MLRDQSIPLIPAYRLDCQRLVYTFAGQIGLALLLFFIFVQRIQAQKMPVRFPDAAQKVVLVLTYNIIPGNADTYGYDIYANGRLQVHQPMIPALSGNKGFATKEAAKKVARLVIEKIRNGSMPPTVSVEEMKNLRAI